MDESRTVKKPAADAEKSKKIKTLCRKWNRCNKLPPVVKFLLYYCLSNCYYKIYSNSTHVPKIPNYKFVTVLAMYISWTVFPY
jgi:hypothetical protein